MHLKLLLSFKWQAAKLRWPTNISGSRFSFSSLLKKPSSSLITLVYWCDAMLYFPSWNKRSTILTSWLTSLFQTLLFVLHVVLFSNLVYIIIDAYIQRVWIKSNSIQYQSHFPTARSCILLKMAALKSTWKQPTLVNPQVMAFVSFCDSY